MTAVSSAALADQVREALGIREWAASCTPTKYGEQVESEIPPAFAALDRLVALLDSERQAREKAERERDEARLENADLEQEVADMTAGQTEALRQLAAAEADRDRLAEAVTEYLSDATAGGEPITPQWYIDCNDRTGNYPSKARLARALLAAAGSGGNTEATT